MKFSKRMRAILFRWGLGGVLSPHPDNPRDRTPLIPFACFQIGGTVGMFLGFAAYIIDSGKGNGWYVLAGIGIGICTAMLGCLVLLLIWKWQDRRP